MCVVSVGAAVLVCAGCVLGLVSKTEFVYLVIMDCLMVMIRALCGAHLHCPLVAPSLLTSLSLLCSRAAQPLPGTALPASQLPPCTGIAEASGRLLQEAEMGKKLT